jgi:hypothetical protein
VLYVNLCPRLYALLNANKLNDIATGWSKYCLLLREIFVDIKNFNTNFFQLLLRLVSPSQTERLSNSLCPMEVNLLTPRD